MGGHDDPEPFTFPVIPEGALTTLIPFLVTTAPPPTKAVQKGPLIVTLMLCTLIFCMPRFILKSKWCCSWFKGLLSRTLQYYFCFALVLNITLFGFVFLGVRGFTVNELFFSLVKTFESFLDKLEKVLTEVAMLCAMYIFYILRRRFLKLLGVERQMVRADCRDVLTCFSMSRYGVIELAIWKCEGLLCGFSARSLFITVTLGYNEPQNTRPHDGVRADFACRERMQLNYDNHDDASRISIVVKQQEIVSSAIGAMAPGVGAIGGAMANLMTPLGPGGGAVAGAVTGIGAANSLGKEVGRVELSSAMVNRLSEAKGPTQDGRFAWNEEHFHKVDMIPQGALWLRLSEVEWA